MLVDLDIEIQELTCLNNCINFMKLENPTKTIPKEKSLLPTRSYHSIELFKGRSFRVGWGKGYTFTTICNIKNINLLALEPHDPKNLDTFQLIHYLQAVLKNTIFKTKGTLFQNKSTLEQTALGTSLCQSIFSKNIDDKKTKFKQPEIISLSSTYSHDNSSYEETILNPLDNSLREQNPQELISNCNIVKSKALLADLTEIATSTKMSPSNHEFQTNHELVFKLINVFWSQKSPYYETKSKFSQWLEEAIQTNSCETLELGLQPHEKVVSNILIYLSSHKIKQAADYAAKINMPEASLLISQINSTVTSKKFLQKQISQWIDTKALNYFEMEILKLYMILSGYTNFNNVNIVENFDWMRSLGMFLWYISPQGQHLRHALSLYEEAFNSFAQMPFASYSPDYCKYFNVLFLIMKLYVDKKYPLEEIITPGTHTANYLDYSFSWLLLQLFKSLKLGTVSENVVNEISIKFSCQLEAMGLYDWAVFVVLFIKDEHMKKQLVIDILTRNLLDDEDCKDKEFNLVKNFRIPVAWIEDIKAQRFSQLGNYWSCSKHLFYASKWRECHETAINHVIPILVINGNFNEAKQYLKQVAPYSKYIVNWMYEGGLILDFMKLKQTFLVYEKGNSGLINYDFFEKLNYLIGRLKHFPLCNDSSAVCVAIIFKYALIMWKRMCGYYDGMMSDFSVLKLEDLVMPVNYEMNELLACLVNYCPMKSGV